MSTRRLTVRAGGCSARIELRALATLALLAALTLVAFTFQVGHGDYPIAPLDVLAALVGAGDEATSFIVVDLRLPRALVALLAGAALGIAGTLLQELARNPLVAPDVIGISSGASLAAVALIVLGDVDGALSVPLAALGGGLVAGAALYLLAWCGGVDGYRMVLIGIGLTALFQGVISYVLTQGRIYEAATGYVWLVGSLNNRGWEHVWPLVATLAVALPLLPALTRRLGAMQLGDEVARTLGVRVERARMALLATAVVLTAVAVAATGPIAFVAFIAPHVARRIGHSIAPATIVPIAAVAGALLVICADLAGRTLFAPTQIPVGIITAIIAAPYFLALLRRANRLGMTG